MKRVVSVSAGSSKRDKKTEVEIGGETFSIERIGTDSDMNKYVQLLEELDGKVDAIGLGGVDLYLYSAGKRYTFKQVARLASHVKKTPIVDGSGLKNTLERRTVEVLQDQGIVDFSKSNVLMVCGVDRFGMAEALRKTGCKLIIGDLMFSLGIPLPMKSWTTYRIVTRSFLPVVTRFPISWLYPTGEKQEVITPKFEKYYQWADVIAGDWLFIRKHLPERVDGKIILTNTTTESDVELLKSRGARLLITTTPELSGRSFGTNVMEGVMLVLSGKSSLRPEEYMSLLEKNGWKPRITDLTK